MQKIASALRTVKSFLQKNRSSLDCHVDTWSNKSVSGDCKRNISYNNLWTLPSCKLSERREATALGQTGERGPEGEASVRLRGLCGRSWSRVLSRCPRAPTGSDYTQFKKKQKREDEEDE